MAVSAYAYNLGVSKEMVTYEPTDPVSVFAIWYLITILVTVILSPTLLPSAVPYYISVPRD